MTTFVRMLPNAHQLKTVTKEAALDILASQSLVVGSPTGETAVLREWCAALTWMLSRPQMSIDDVLDLSRAQRATLAAMLKVQTNGGTQDFSQRLLRAMKGHDNETFLSIMCTTHPELSGLTQSQVDRRLANVSFNHDPANLAEARELCAIKAWCQEACTTAADWSALPVHLRDFVRMIHGVNKHFPEGVIASTIATVVNCWRDRVAPGRNKVIHIDGGPGQQPAVQAAGVPQSAPPAGHPPSLPSGPLSSTASGQPAPSGAPPSGGGGGPPPPAVGGLQLPPAAQPVAPPVQAGVTPPYNFPLALGSGFGYPYYAAGGAPLLHHGPVPPPYSTLPLQPQPQPFVASGASAAGAGASAAGAGATGAGPLGSFPLSGSWPAHLTAAQQAEGQRELDRQKSLSVDVLGMIPKSERRRYLEAKKINQDVTTLLPYQSYPPKQQLVIADNDPFDPARSGRQLRIALVADSDRFYDATVVMIRRQRQEREALLVAEFYKSFNEQKAAAALLTVERIKGFSQEVANITEQRLRDFATTFPHPELWHIHGQRAQQAKDMPIFLQALSAQITRDAHLKPAKQQEAAMMGAWKLFVDAWSIQSVDSDLSAELKAASAAYGTGGAGGSGGAARSARSGSSGSEESSDDDRDRRHKRAKPSPSSSSHRMPSDIGDTIPCSEPVVGKGLGRADEPKNACTTCGKKGHWRVDCPLRWAQAGKQLPGFGPNGRRLKGAWEDGNPTKETFGKWVRFLEDTNNFPSGARAMPKPGAPSLKSFKKAARSGAPK